MTNPIEKIKTVNLRVKYNDKIYECAAPTNVSLLDNIENMNVDIRSSCRLGRCGSCKIRFVNGKLNTCIIEDGYVQSCVAY
jgi:ferredoxin